MRNLYEIIDQRATCRAFKVDAISDEVLNRVLEAGCKSPSSGGFQHISIIQVTDPEKRKKLVEYSRGQTFIATAPVSLVFCVDHHRARQILHIEPAPFPQSDGFKHLMMGVADAAICAQTMVLAAEQEGLGSCYIGNIVNVMQQVSELLALPEGVFPTLMLTLGWPVIENRKQPLKYPMPLLVHENRYQEQPDQELYEAYRKKNKYQKMPASKERVDACCARAYELHGPEYAEKVQKNLEEKGYLGTYQYWLGVYYTQEPEFMDNAMYHDYFLKQGFQWLEK